MAGAWKRSMERTQRAHQLGLKSHHAQVERLDDWMSDTDKDLRNIIQMPEHAQRVLSATVGALQVHEFERRLKRDKHWDGSRRLVNWLAQRGWNPGRWAMVVSHSRKGIPSAHMHWDSISDLATLGMWADPGSYAWYVGGPR